MNFPLTIRLVNTSTGEILHRNVLNDFCPTIPKDMERLHSYLDLFLSSFDKFPNDSLKIEFDRHFYPNQSSF